MYSSSSYSVLLNLSGLVADGHCHEVLIADLDDSIEVRVPRLEVIGQAPQHHTRLDEIIKLEALLGESVEPGHHQLAEGHAHSEAHLIVGCVELIEVDVARAIPVVAVKDTLPLVDVLPELLKLSHVNGTTVITIKQTYDSMVAQFR